MVNVDGIQASQVRKRFPTQHKQSRYITFSTTFGKGI